MKRKSILEQVLSIYVLIREELITKIENLHKAKGVKIILFPDQKQIIRETQFTTTLTLRTTFIPGSFYISFY